jgi:hypothetical protein
MDFSMQLHNEEGYTRITLQGSPSLGQFLSLVDLLSIDSHAWPVNKLLVDLRRVDSLTSFTDQFSIGEKAARVLGHLHIASVVQPQRVTRVSEKAANRGGAHVQVFTAEEEAVAWLLRASGAPPFPGDDAQG